MQIKSKEIITLKMIMKSICGNIDAINCKLYNIIF